MEGSMLSVRCSGHSQRVCRHEHPHECCCWQLLCSDCMIYCFTTLALHPWTPLFCRQAGVEPPRARGCNQLPASRLINW